MNRLYPLLLVLFLISCGTESKSSYTFTTSVTPVNGGSISPSSGEYDEGARLTITATPTDGYRFVEWGGDASGTDNEISITIDSDLTISATFEDLNLEDGEVYSVATGRIWMDRNLGASRVATSVDDEEAFGFLYQWGRGTDGHQIRTSNTTTTTSDSDQPGHGDFILIPGDSDPADWRNPQNDNLWQGVDGINNPCPTGFRLPTMGEWSAEVASWSSNDTDGAFSSSLKLTLSGFRTFGDTNDGGLGAIGLNGFYTSSTIDGTATGALIIGEENQLSLFPRAGGIAVRCIKD